MYRTILFLIFGTGLFASSSMHEDHSMPGQSMKKTMQEKKASDPYLGYVSKEPSKQAATAVYRCGCEDRPWRQDASKSRACPYCGPAMPECGTLIKLLPKRGKNYSIQDYDLPNTICPVSGKRIVNKKYFTVIEGKKIFFDSKKDKELFERRSERYFRKLPLKPERFGFVKPKETAVQPAVFEEMDPAEETSHDDHGH